MIVEIIFISASAFLLYTYLVYPLVTIIFAQVKRDSRNHHEYLPTVTVLMPVHNEEKVLESKLDKLLQLHYPDDRLEIIVGSDASTDNTDNIAGKYSSLSNRIRFIRSDKRIGKAGMLNLLSRQAGGEILAITDANVMPSQESLFYLTSHFSDEKTGICDAWPVSITNCREGITVQEKVYSSFEMRLKKAESKAWGTMAGPYGGFYAVRKDIFPFIPGNILVDDLFVGLYVISKGYNLVNEEKALVYEDIPSGIKGQFQRRIRIATGSFQNLFYWGAGPGRFFSRANFCYISHKLMRWISPLAMIAFFMTTIILSTQSLFYLALVFGQFIFLILSVLDTLLLKAGVTVKPLRFATQFLMMNTALMVGMVNAVRGVKEGIWEPTQRV